MVFKYLIEDASVDSVGKDTLSLSKYCLFDSLDIIKSKNWGDQEWADFFSKIIEQDFTNIATEQWDSHSR